MVVETKRPWPGSTLEQFAMLGTAKSPGSSASSGSGRSYGDIDLDSAESLPEQLLRAVRCPTCSAPTNLYSLYCVFDGHNGVAAAKLVSERLVEVLEARLPAGVPPQMGTPAHEPWREDIQLALVETMAELNRAFAERGIQAGCTATLVLQIGWLLTCANLGDSRAVLDTGSESMMLTVDHRVASHKGERRRVEAMGATIAPVDFTGSGPARNVDNGVGPLRIWPGGLCLSRAIGDFDVGESVVPFPHIAQVLLPPTGARLMVASDGVWDAFEKMTRVGTMARSWPLETCPARMIQVRWGSSSGGSGGGDGRRVGACRGWRAAARQEGKRMLWEGRPLLQLPPASGALTSCH